MYQGTTATSKVSQAIMLC